MPPENSAPNVSRETYFRNLFQKYPDFDVSRETFAQLEIYHTLLIKWQKAVNLVSPKTLENAWERHFEDSAQILPLLPKNEVSPPQKQGSENNNNQIPNPVRGNRLVLLDFGSGAGFPGLVLGIMNPDIKVHLVESDSKKCEFLKNVSRETYFHKNNKILVHNCRIESLENDIAPDIITARALADLTSLLEFCTPYAAKNPNLVLFFPKGGHAGPEIEEAQNVFSFDMIAHQSVTNAEAKILEIRHLARRQ